MHGATLALGTTSLSACSNYTTSSANGIIHPPRVYFTGTMKILNWNYLTENSSM